MYDLARMSSNDREIVFINTANKMEVNEAIIEKDFWVVLILEYLFNKCKYKDYFTFKGGTSLSKSYSIIRRFSEDIDIILDWTILGVPKDEPYRDRSKTKQGQYNEYISKLVEVFIENQLLDEIKNGLETILDYKINMYCDSKEKNTIIFEYPRQFNNNSILRVIRIEFGPLAAWIPSKLTKVSSYINDFYPKVFKQAFTEVLTVTPERTFWEKATILYHEANRPISSKIPTRYSRHYYDVLMMYEKLPKEELISDLDLLKKVVKFKMKFYPRGWANYNLAKPGTLRLVPDQYRFKELINDYRAMKDMLFGEIPKFNKIMETIKELENLINRLIK